MTNTELTYLIGLFVLLIILGIAVVVIFGKDRKEMKED